MALGHVVRRWRLELDWQQKDLERRTCGVVKQSQISDLERGRLTDPSGATWEALAVAFSVSVDVLMRAAGGAPAAIPSIMDALPSDLAGLPGWARDFHRWGRQISPAQRQSVLDLVRSLADAAAARGESREVPPDAL